MLTSLQMFAVIIASVTIVNTFLIARLRTQLEAAKESLGANLHNVNDTLDKILDKLDGKEPLKTTPRQKRPFRERFK